MIDKRDGTTKKPVKTQEYFPQANPSKRPRGGGKGGKRGR
ncbi:hypothetical protein PS691_05680 [Pseudomonas fluorescens]|uniref:Uncharacterized protein n=1 Tax=Pseudomonas fluorescens TaxID=294 RepID=A0A5E7FTK6_PSEFL|nr:hypothetical protein PS691_05680 [Pseudomonas fluorescens]